MLFFVAFLLLAGFVVLNMLVGVVVENFQKCRDMIEKDRLAEKEKKKAEKLQLGTLIDRARAMSFNHWQNLDAVDVLLLETLTWISFNFFPNYLKVITPLSLCNVA